MFYLRAFVNSLYNFSWINKNRKDIGKAGAYFIFFVLVLSLFYAVYFSWKIPQVIGQFQDEVVSQVPEFTLQIEEGELSVEGLEQPFILESEEEGDEKFVFIVDTETNETLVIEDFIDPSAESGILITKDKFMIHDSSQAQTRVQFFSGIDGVVFDKGDIVYWVERFAGGLPYFAFFVILTGVFVGLVIGKLIYLLIISLVIWTASHFGNKSYKYEEIYTMGMYAITLPSILKLFLDITGNSLIYAYTTLLLIVMIAAIFGDVLSIKRLRSKKKDKMI